MERERGHAAMDRLWGCAALLSIVGATRMAAGDEGSPHERLRRAPQFASVSALPLRFEPNQGQMDPRVRLAARGLGYGLFLTDEGATLVLSRPRPAEGVVGCTPAANRHNASRHSEPSVVSIRVANARAVKPIGFERLPGTSNYLVGSDPSRWRMGVEGYGRVRYAQVLPGVDLVLYGTGQRQLEYDVVLAAGVDPRSVVLSVEGVDAIEVDAEGAALLALPGGGRLVEPRPVAYQLDHEGRKIDVEVRYDVHGHSLGFVVGKHDPGRPLVIDPVYSTFLGGSALDEGQGIAADSAGNVYVAGFTQSTNFPEEPYSFDPLDSNHGGAADAFVTKVMPNGLNLAWSTYIGGNGDDEAEAIALDAQGHVDIAGFTDSTNFPTTLSAFQTKLPGILNAFVTQLNASTGSPVYSTYLGGDANDTANGIAADPAGEVFVAGYTSSNNFPTTASPFQGALTGSQNAFVTKLSAAGSSLVYSTFLGGNYFDTAQAVALDAAGDAFITGSTYSSNFPSTSGALLSTLGGTLNAFVTKLAASGSTLVYSTYLGGNELDSGQGIAVDSSGDAFVAGTTTSSNFPVTAGAYQPAFGGIQNGFVSKLNPTATALAYSTYLGGNGTDQANAIAIDTSGNAFVAGFTSSTNFPTVPANESQLLGTQDAFFTKLNANGVPTLSTYLGGSDNDQANAIAVDAADNAYLTGLTTSSNFVTNPSGWPTYSGNGDAFVTKFATVPPVAVPALGRRAPWLGAALLWIGLLVSRRKVSGAVPH